MPPSDVADDAQQVMSANKAAVSRALNLVEDRRAESHARVAELLAALKDAPKSTDGHRVGLTLSLIHISEPTRPFTLSRMPSSA